MLNVAYKVGLIMLILVTLGTYGCGSSDGPLDEIEQRYSATLTVLDLDEETIQVDVVQDICSDDNGTIEYEDFSDALGEVTVTASEGTAGLTLKSYEIQYTPLESADSLNILRMPPELADPPDGATSVAVPANSTVTFTITLISVDTKAAYVYLRSSDSNLSNLAVARYHIEVTLHFEDENGNDKDITVERTVYFSDYDHC